jgi:hypothetical protein
LHSFRGAFFLEKETKETNILIAKVGKESEITAKEKAEAEISEKETNQIAAEALQT